MTVLALALCYAGLAALCFAMRRHHRQLRSRDPAAAGAWALRTLGAALLTAAAAVCAGQWGAAAGAVAWLAALPVTGGVLVLMLPYAPRAAAAAALAAPPLGLAAAAIGLP